MLQRIISFSRGSYELTLTNAWSHTSLEKYTVLQIFCMPRLWFFFVFLFTTYIRPLVERGTQVWGPYHLKDVIMIESVQGRIPKFFSGLFNVRFLNRFEILSLKSLVNCWIVNDMLFIFKIMRGLVDLPFEKYCSFTASNTRCNSIKMDIISYGLLCRQTFFL